MKKTNMNELNSQKLLSIEEKIYELNVKVERANFEKLQLLIYFNLLITLTLLAFVIGAVVKQLN